MSPVRYELGFYIPEDGILQSHCRGSSESYKHCDTLCPYVPHTEAHSARPLADTSHITSHDGLAVT
jgi:hypothetical protein